MTGYAITDFSKVSVDYKSTDGTTVWRQKMRNAFLGAFGADSPIAFSAGTTAPKGLKMAHYWCTATDSTPTPPKKYRKKVIINGNAIFKPVGTALSVTIDGLSWATMGYVGQKVRDES
jgi:hypothetical protein